MTATLDPARLDTVQVIPMTAFDAQGRLALDPMRRLTRQLFEAGVRVFLPCAGSAEFHSLSNDEIVAGVGMTSEVVGREAVVLAPVGRQNTEAVDLGRRCLDAGADGLLVMPLDFPYLSDAGMRDYYRTLLDRLEAPVLLYKKAPLPSDALLLELADHENMYGVKYAVNDIDAFQHIVAADRHGVHWSCGSAERFAPYFMLAGATAYTSAAANLCPRTTLAMHAALTAGDWAEAMRLQRLLLPIEDFRAREGNSFNVAFLKYALTHLDLDCGPPRPPGRPLNDADKVQIDRVTREALAVEQSLLAAKAAHEK